MNESDVLKALKCCRKDSCDQCPLQKEICDTLTVEMEKIPRELLDLVEGTLEQSL